jgi:hypothetical protein
VASGQGLPGKTGNNTGFRPTVSRVASFILVTEMVIVASSGLLPKVILLLMVRKR